MNKPENFRKIDSKTFNTPSGYEYKFSTDGFSPELWVFRQPDTTAYCLAFVIDWKAQTYAIRKAGNGNGTNWVNNVHSGNFASEIMKTLDSFIEWARYRVETFETEYD